jgi:hypothetical protein
MLESNVSFKPRFNPALISQKELLSDLYTDLTKERPLSELFNSIIDLEYDINQLLHVNPLEEGGASHKDKESQEEGHDNSMAMMSGYAPKMGLFEMFEA